MQIDDKFSSRRAEKVWGFFYCIREEKTDSTMLHFLSVQVTKWIRAVNEPLLDLPHPPLLHSHNSSHTWLATDRHWRIVESSSTTASNAFQRLFNLFPFSPFNEHFYLPLELLLSLVAEPPRQSHDFSSIYQWIVRMNSSFTLIQLPTDLPSSYGWLEKTQWNDVVCRSARTNVRHATYSSTLTFFSLSFLCSTQEWTFHGVLCVRRLLNFISALPHDLAISNFVYSVNFSISSAVRLLLPFSFECWRGCSLLNEMCDWRMAFPPLLLTQRFISSLIWWS